MDRSVGLSRRAFARTLGLGAGAALLAPTLAARGWEERWGNLASGRLERVKLLPKDPQNLILLNSNENAYGPSRAALEAMVEAHSVAMRYPDYWADLLQEKLASFHGFGPESVAVTCGSTELLKMCAFAFLGPRKRLVLAEPTFEAIAYYARLTGAEIVKVPVDAEYRHDLEGMARAAQERPGLVYICNPNNPTGTVVSRAALKNFLEQVPAESAVLIDEAYFHYSESPDYGTMLDRVVVGARVVVARTFSKIYGMAGLRLGYGVAAKEVMDEVRPHQVFDSWNVMACAAALASLEDEEFVARNRELNRAARDFVVEAMHKRGRGVIPSETNFVCIEVDAPVPQVIQAFRREGISVGRRFSGLPGHIRVSLGTLEEMEKFVAAFDRIQRAAQVA